jgi:Arc/MetJ-type ribon-helix-helix transcriptional regulator
MYYVSRIVTLRLPEELDTLLQEICRRTGRSQSEVIRKALRRQLAVEGFEELRRRVLPFAEADVLVTGDRDLLDLPGRVGLEILTPRAFWNRLRTEDSEESA